MERKKEGQKRGRKGAKKGKKGEKREAKREQRWKPPTELKGNVLLLPWNSGDV